MPKEPKEKLTEPADDGVNREGLDYRAGWVEGLRAFGQRLQIEIGAARAKPREHPGLETARRLAKEMYEAMLAKMKGVG
jgi:hypothetical protein